MKNKKIKEKAKYKKKQQCKINKTKIKNKKTTKINNGNKFKKIKKNK
jgi:hypothetical protein